MQNYTILKEIKSRIDLKFILIWLGVMSLPFIYLLFSYSNYIFRDRLDIFTFMLEGLIILVFPILLTIIYLPSFSQELTNRFLVYTRVRMPIKKMLIIKFSANFLLSFGMFFVFVFVTYVISFYVIPYFNFIPFDPEVYSLNSNSVVEDSYSRHTFTQLLEYGAFTYGLIYSIWVGINAAIYASIGFLSLLLVKNKFVGLSIPFLVYIVGSFVLNFLNLREFRFSDAIFPFSYMQLPIWTAFVPFLFLLLICVVLCLIINKRFEQVNDLL